jgi:hypothetical protein
MCTQYLHCIHPPTQFHNLISPTTDTILPRWDLFCLPILWFCKRKKWHFWLFKIATQGVSLWHFHVYMYYKPNLVHTLYFASFYLSPSFMAVSTTLKILYSFLYRGYINHVEGEYLLKFLLSSPSCMWPLFSVTCFS